MTGNKCVVSAATRRDTAKKCPTQSVFFSYQVPTSHKGPARTGALEETPVEGIVLDTGAAKTMSQQDSEQQIGYRPTIAVRGSLVQSIFSKLRKRKTRSHFNF